MRSVRFFVLLIVFALVAAACSSGSDDTTTTATAETETTTTTETAETTTTETSEPSAETVTTIPGPDGTVFVLDADSGFEVCGYDKDELVSPAPPSVVWEILDDHGISVEMLEPDDERPFPLPVGLNAYILTDAEPNPVFASSLLLMKNIPASPRHIVMPAARWKFGPADEAAAATPSEYHEYAPNQLTDASGDTVVVIDTGSAPSPFPGAFAEAWTGLLTDPAPNPMEPEPAGMDETFFGHGVFVAGVVRQLMPGTSVSIRSATYGRGGTTVFDEHSVVRAISAAVDGELRKSDDELNEAEKGGGVVNLSLGTYACAEDQIPLELAVYLGGIAASPESESPNNDIVFVAAAGNDGEDPGYQPFWPAGFADRAVLEERMASWYYADYPEFADAMAALLGGSPIILGVGALESGTASPAPFSNWAGATVWAPGTEVVSTYPDWDGFARWSGTSFAAPFVSAMIAGCRGGSTYRDSLAQFIADPPLTLTDPTCP
ncbi:MAG: S8 family serine peptidase [Actinomycetota bacterium]|nr:S8 family serine peptidase [Actinomycetota bacterium]